MGLTGFKHPDKGYDIDPQVLFGILVCLVDACLGGKVIDHINAGQNRLPVNDIGYRCRQRMDGCFSHGLFFRELFPGEKENFARIF